MKLILMLKIGLWYNISAKIVDPARLLLCGIFSITKSVFINLFA